MENSIASSISLINNQNNLAKNIEIEKIEKIEEVDKKDDFDITKLITMCCEGSEEAWDRFISRFHSRIMFYVIRTTNSYKVKSLDTSEIVQEVFLKLLANDRTILKMFRGNTEEAFLCYLATIVYNIVLDTIRKEIASKRSALTISLDTSDSNKNISFANLLPASNESCPTLAFSKKESFQKIKQLLTSNFLGKNAFRDIKVFWLYAVYGFSVQEITQLPDFSLTASNIQAIIARTREKLRQIIKQQTISDFNIF